MRYCATSCSFPVMDSYSTRDLWRETRGDVEELELGEFRMLCWELLVAVA